MKRALFLVLLSACLASAGPLAARVLSEFSCERPAAVDEGTAYNVSLACHLVDGKVLAPGEVFSFLNAMQPGRGLFKPGLTISGGRFTQSIGGGYCQVTAAIYNAALLAGLPVLERYNHSLFDPQEAYVPPGLDAAVSQESSADFRFVNTTPAPLTLSAQCQGLKVSLSLLGSSRRKARWVSSQVIERKRFPVRRSEDKRLNAGEEKVEQAGYDGLLVESYVHYLDSSGNTVTTLASRDRYIRVPQIVRFGPENKP